MYHYTNRIVPHQNVGSEEPTENAGGDDPPNW